MSSPAPDLDRLPEALQKRIYKNLTDRDILSLAVVCKEVSRNALPRLYLRSVLTIPREEEPVHDLWRNRWSKKQQNRYCKTLKRHPEFGQEAHTLYLSFSYKRIGFNEVEEEEDTATINQVANALNKLQHLVRLEVFQTRNVTFPDSLLAALPPSLAVVNLEHSALSGEGCLALLRRLPLLAYFKLFISDEPQLESHLPLHHPKLAYLAVDLTAVSPAFFLAITHDVPNLTSFECDFKGLNKMKGSSFLRQLKKLYVLGQFTYWHSLDPSPWALELGSILDDCTTLEFLAVQATDINGMASEILVSIEEHDIFRHIPPSITELNLLRLLLKPSYILSTV